LATTIKKSKHYPQLHAVIFAKQNILPNGRSDFHSLAKAIELPILVLETTKKSKSAPIWSPNTNALTADEIFKIACPTGMKIPEAIRVAEIISATF